MNIAALLILLLGGILLIVSLSSIQTDRVRAFGSGVSGNLMSLLGGGVLLFSNATKKV